ncbi:M16 family metallopeptidase [Robertkochia solimangrovi]|uniref:M16 family metallopeptidase n=1 Tax=Robertkochia solimangrovi TaxID=2213046 RepID=UPI00117E2223|nr:M16 family metallopeptidase [Robertkochia solimangrovi]TRZ41593.1 hypothetical protein DMZ48_16415 [Robertkochia solimangrovi]
MRLIRISRMLMNLMLLSILFITGKTLHAQIDPLALDSTITTGALRNGMTYFIKHNQEPKNRVSFYFAQNVGSVLENDNQRGLAHFLEHMAFNGTENFRDKGMLNYLEKYGIKFGSEINAFTSFDRTVYNINDVPTSNERLIDSVLLILHDWSGSLLLLDEEIDKERGVVNEEWRMRNTPLQRAGEIIFSEGLVKGSIYEKRLPIGSMEVINNFKYDELRDYYKKWYRPDQQSVIIVGDIDPAEIEKKIINTFSSIPLSENKVERPVFNTPINEELVFIESLDDELRSPTIHYYIKSAKENIPLEDYLNNKTISGLAIGIFNNRMSELLNEEDSPAYSIKLDFENQVRPLDALSLTITPKKDQTKEAFEFALTELARYAKFGATSGELERAKKKRLSSYDMSLNNLNKISSKSYAKKIYEYALEGTPFPNYEWFGKEVLKRLSDYTNEEILKFINNKFKYKNQMFGLTGSTDKTYITKIEVLDIIEKVKTSSPEPFEDKFKDEPLITSALKGGQITSTFKIDGVSAKGFVLENGARLILYPTEFANSNIQFKVYSPGGISMLDNDLLSASGMTTQLISESGVGNFDEMSLAKKLAGVNQSYYMYLHETDEGIMGRTAKNDLETLFKRFYLSFTAPRFDETTFEAKIKSWKQGVKTKYKNKSTRFNEAVRLAKTDSNKRTLIFDDSLLNTITIQNVKNIYHQRFDNPGDFTFLMVGDIDEQQIVDLFKEYIGSIPSTGKKEKFRNHNLNPAKGKTEVHLQEEMETPQTTVQIFLEDQMDYTQKNYLKMKVAGQLLMKRYMEEIREKEGGSYSVGAYGYMRPTPENRYYLQVKFNCNPEMTEKLVGIVYAEFKRLETKVNEDQLNEIKNHLIKKHNEEIEGNTFWLDAIYDFDMNGLEILSPKEYEALVNSITAGDIKVLMKEINKNADLIEGILEPQKPL